MRGEANPVPRRMTGCGEPRHRVRRDAFDSTELSDRLMINSIADHRRLGTREIRLSLIIVERVNSSVQLSVSDSGQGIDAEFLPFVFDRFRQADSTTTRRHAGLGLGLSIVKQLVELHGGSVQATSSGKNQGATFVVTLPLAAEAHRDFSGKRTSGVEQSVREQKHATLSGIRVLVVDDEPDATSLVERILKPFGAEVVCARSQSTTH